MILNVITAVLGLGLVALIVAYVVNFKRRNEVVELFNAQLQARELLKSQFVHEHPPKWKQWQIDLLRALWKDQLDESFDSLADVKARARRYESERNEGKMRTLWLRWRKRFPKMLRTVERTSKHMSKNMLLGRKAVHCSKRFRKLTAGEKRRQARLRRKHANAKFKVISDMEAQGWTLSVQHVKRRQTKSMTLVFRRPKTGMLDVFDTKEVPVVMTERAPRVFAYKGSNTLRAMKRIVLGKKKRIEREERKRKDSAA
jgi:hypothetical protein